MDIHSRFIEYLSVMPRFNQKVCQSKINKYYLRLPKEISFIIGVLCETKIL